MKKFVLITFLAFNVIPFNVNATPAWLTDMLTKFSLGSSMVKTR